MDEREQRENGEGDNATREGVSGAGDGSNDEVRNEKNEHKNSVAVLGGGR